MDITLRALDNIENVLDETVDIGVGEMEIPGCSNDTARSLINLVKEMHGLLVRVVGDDGDAGWLGTLQEIRHLIKRMEEK